MMKAFRWCSYPDRGIRISTNIYTIQPGTYNGDYVDMIAGVNETGVGISKDYGAEYVDPDNNFKIWWNLLQSKGPGATVIIHIYVLGTVTEPIQFTLDLPWVYKQPINYS